LTENCAGAANLPATSDHVATLWIELLAAADASLFLGEIKLREVAPEEFSLH
jgi:hypothetical protein